MTFNNQDILKKYIDYISIDKSESTITNYKYSLYNFFKYFNHDYSLITRKTIEEYISCQSQNKLSADTIHLRAMALKSFYRFLAKERLIAKEKFFDLFDDLKTPKIIIKSQLVVKAKEVIEITDNFKTNTSHTFLTLRNKLIILLLSNTGIRRCEARNIDINNINLKDNTITLYKTKGFKPRLVSFSKSIRNILVEYLKERENILREKINKKNDLLFIKLNGSSIHVNSISYIMKRVAKNNNVKITCHSLRRGFATDMAEEGTDLTILSRMMGHSNINTTVSRYIYVLSGMIKDAMERHPFSKEIKEKDILKIKENINQEDIINMFNVLTSQMNDISNRIKQA